MSNPTEIEEEVTWTHIGNVDVDAGLIHVGDPCYISDDPKQNYADDWSKFCNWLEKNMDEESQSAVVEHNPGQPGKAIVVGGFGGDGSYPVYIAQGSDGVTRQLVIDFAGDMASEDDDSDELEIELVESLDDD